MWLNNFVSSFFLVHCVQNGVLAISCWWNSSFYLNEVCGRDHWSRLLVSDCWDFYFLGFWSYFFRLHENSRSKLQKYIYCREWEVEGKGWGEYVLKLLVFLRWVFYDNIRLKILTFTQKYTKEPNIYCSGKALALHPAIIVQFHTGSPSTTKSELGIQR